MLQLTNVLSPCPALILAKMSTRDVDRYQTTLHDLLRLSEASYCLHNRKLIPLNKHSPCFAQKTLNKFSQLDDEIAKLKALKAELGSSGQNLAVDKKLSGSKEGQKPSAASAQPATLVQDPRVKEQGDLVRRLKSSKVVLNMCSFPSFICS